jgi:hypothetical protein
VKARPRPERALSNVYSLCWFREKRLGILPGFECTPLEELRDQARYWRVDVAHVAPSTNPTWPSLTLIQVHEGETVSARVHVHHEGELRQVARLEGSPRTMLAFSRFALIRALDERAAWRVFRATLIDVERKAL